MITHETTEEAIRQAVAAIEKDGKVSERPQVIRIEKLNGDDREMGAEGQS
jgi:homoserine dehydrogenase